MFGACVKKEHLALFQVQRSAHTPDDKGGMRFATSDDSDWVTFAVTPRQKGQARE